MTRRSGFPRLIPSLAQLVDAGTVPLSRRDMMRASAVVAAAAAVKPNGITAAPTRPSSTHARAQEEIATGVELYLPFNPYGQPVTVEPHTTVNWGPFWVMMPYAWSGLLRFDENGAVEPDLAESVEPNEDGTIWTATLKEGIAFANGDPIFAEHFVNSWTRALNPTQVSPMARFMSPVQGFEPYIAGESQSIGFRAIDDRTIEITLSDPVSHFPSWLATFVWAVVHPGYLAPQEGAEIPLADASAGPWRVAEFDDAARIVMTPNEHYWAPPSPSISSIVWNIAPGGGTDQLILDQYAADQVAIADVPATLLTVVDGDPALAEDLRTIEDHASTLAIGLDFNQAPFDDVRVRRAIAHAIDKERWANEIQAGEYVAAPSFTPPVLAKIANYDAPEGIAFDADQSVSLLEEAGIDLENLAQEIIYFHPANDPVESIEQVAQLLDMIQENTGIIIDLNAGLTREQITALQQDNGGLQFSIVQWWLDSNTPSLLAVATQDSEYNAGWINWDVELQADGDFTPGDDAARYSELVAEAIATLDEAARNELYAEAESLLLENAVFIPLGYWVQRYLQKPWLQGTRQGPWSGSVPVRIDEEVIVVGGPQGTPFAG